MNVQPSPRRAALLLASLWAISAQAYNPNNREEYLAKIKAAEALYKEKCAKVAGIRIYKTVPEVEGLAADEDSAGYHGPGTGRPQLAGCGVWAGI